MGRLPIVIAVPTRNICLIMKTVSLFRRPQPLQLRPAVLLFSLLFGCTSSTTPLTITSENQNSRVSILVIHHTSANFVRSLELLTHKSDRPVSSHYLIPDPFDPTYPNNKLEVLQLVAEDRRAWHAGVSNWTGKRLLNDQSIGIEIVNQTYCHPAIGPIPEDDAAHPTSVCFYPDFPEPQISLLVKLIKEILARHPDILPTNIVGHSDIAPDRKIDPGPQFPWQGMYKLGIGAWYDDATVIKYWEQFRLQLPPVSVIQDAFQTYGYGIEISGQDDQPTSDVIRAFQLHFRPSEITGKLSVNTVAILFALVEKYHPEELNRLIENIKPPETSSTALR